MKWWLVLWLAVNVNSILFKGYGFLYDLAAG
jgi:hypothetical protein